jgi:hypothetical protein
MRRKLYVSGTKNGNLQAMAGAALNVALRERGRGTEWWARNYPILYELVPVDAEALKPKRRKERSERR